MIQSINPATEEVIAEVPESTDAEVDHALDAARSEARRWRTTPVADRTKLLARLADTLDANNKRLAALITSEMGKPIAEAEAEITKCAWVCRHFAEQAETLLADRQVQTEAHRSLVAFEPLGVLLAIMPWNFPFWQLFRAAVPAIAAGNSVILKHALNVPLCAAAIADTFREAQAPSGLLQSILIGNDATQALIADPRIAAVTLTGSTRAGRLVASDAGKALKKQVLELGGSDPFIILADADLEKAASTAARARNQNSGQSCIAAKRFIVEDSVADAFLEKFVAAVAALKLGNPADRSVNVGPLARADLRDNLQSQVEKSVNDGASIALGGKQPEGKGYFYQPTVLDGVRPGMAAFDEETFGPAAAVIRARNTDDAIDLANASEYGLGSALWTTDLDRANALARRIDSGSVFINALVASDPRLPFGGIKQSGYGRELGEYGILEFVNIKTIWINKN